MCHGLQAGPPKQVKTMPEPRKRRKSYNIPGHAHELTSTCYHNRHYFEKTQASTLFLESFSQASQKYNFQIWAYVIMPTHVHLLIFPKEDNYRIAKILQGIKGPMSTNYRKWLKQNHPSEFEKMCVPFKGRKVFRFWQPGGGFDRNLWNADAIHSSISYIEHNPVRAGLVEAAEDWQWSSAWARKHGTGLVPDDSDLPIFDGVIGF